MNDIFTHLILFLVTAGVITALGVVFTEREDDAALRAWPRRMLGFSLGCAVLAAVMLACEMTFATG